MNDYVVLDVVGIDVAPNGAVRLRVGDAFNEEGYSADTPVYGLPNVVSVPLPPENGEAAQAMCVENGVRRRIVAMRDNRIASKGGSLQPGDTAIYTDGEAKVLVKRDSDSVALYTVGADSGNSMMVTVDGANDQILLHTGGAFIKVGQDEIVLAVNGGGALRLSKDGLHFQGNNAEVKASTIKMGGNIPPGPVVPTQAAAVGVAGPINVVVPTIGFYP
jgi:hypothetical protein